jgi:FkbM family methyltransferase
LSLYRIPWLARFIRSSLNRAAPEGLAVVRVAAGRLSGMRLALNMHEEKEFWLGTYEPGLQAALLEQIKPGSVVYDLGANIGYFSLLMASLVGPQGRVFAFEALPSNVERLNQNIALNDLSGRITVISAAVADRSRLMTFLVGPSNRMGKLDGSSGRRSVDYREAIEIDCISLDDLVYKQGQPVPALVKMDIEGGEVLALPGMRRVLMEARPVLLLELHGEEAAQVAWRELSQSGYRLASLEKGYPPVISLEALDWKSYLIAFPGG